jgi:uncharacterized protein (TIGR03905 family)
MDKTYTYLPKGTCSVKMILTFAEDDTIRDFTVVGGCPGNLQGIRRLIIGMKASEVAEKLRGTKCGAKNTSCPDQLSKAIDAYLASERK